MAAVALISSPGYHNPDIGSVGQLVAMDLATGAVRFTLAGTDDRAKFGWAAAIVSPSGRGSGAGCGGAAGNGKTLLLVSASSAGKKLVTLKNADKDMAGAVMTFDFGSLHGDLTVGTRTAPLATLHGDADFAGLGWTLQAVNSTLALVGAPFHSHEAGRVLAVDPATLAVTTTYTAHAGQKHNSRFGASLAVVADGPAGAGVAFASAPIHTTDAAERVGTIHTLF